MHLEQLTEIEILKTDTMKYIIENDKEIEFRLRAKELRVTGTFEKMLKQYKRKYLDRQKNDANFCNFDDEYVDVCTGVWVTSKEGIFKQQANYETGELINVEASRMMILPTETYRNIDTGIEKVKLSYHKYGKWNSFVTDKVTISNFNKIVELSNLGLDVNSINAKDLMSFLYDCLTLNDDNIIPHFKSISRLGWVDGDFMPYNSEIKFDGENENKYTYDAIRTKGSFDKWVEYTRTLRKNKLLKIQMAVSFASPLVEKINALPFVCHLWGGTGSGKTVGMMVAMSIWGNPAFGALTKTMNMTPNSMMSTCAFLRNIPFAGDELQMIVNRFDNYDNLIMKICEGVDRGRMKFDRNNETKTWKNTFLFTGEEPVTKENSGGGVKNRVIEISCSNKKVIESGNETVNFIAENYGFAGLEIIKAISNENIIELYKKTLKKCMEELHTTEKQGMALSLMVLGDFLAEKYIYKTNDFLTFSDLKQYAFSEKQVNVSERAYSLTMSYISSNSNKFSSNGLETWGKIEDTHILINRNILAKYLQSEKIDLKAVLENWKDSNYIELNTQGRYTHQTKCFGIKSNYIKLFNDSELEIDENVLPF